MSKGKGKGFLKITSIVLSIAIVAIVVVYTSVKFTKGKTSTAGSDIEGQRIESTEGSSPSGKTDSDYEKSEENKVKDEEKGSNNSGFYGKSTDDLKVKNFQNYNRNLIDQRVRIRSNSQGRNF